MDHVDMAEFLEESLNGGIQYGSSWTDDYNVNVISTAGGQEYRSLVHIFPVRKFDVTFMMDNVNMWVNLVNIYHRAHGKYAGFRAKCIDEYTSNQNGTTPETAFDQPMGIITAGSVYQLRKYYGTDKTAGTVGYSYRIIHKPVVGTALVAIQNTPIRAADWSIDYTTGIVTFVSNKSITITGISQASQAVISTSNTQGLVVGQSICISDVSGMTQINGLRAFITNVVTNVSVTVNISSSGFYAYTSGGVANTNPQSGESVTAGYQFDFPVRFNSTLPVGQNKPMYRDISSIELIEVLNP